MITTDLSSCSSCHRPALSHSHGPASLVVLPSPSGDYAICARCLERDLEPRAAAPTTMPRKSTQIARGAKSDPTDRKSTP